MSDEVHARTRKRPRLGAFERGVVLAVLTLIELAFLRDLMADILLSTALGGLLLLAVTMNAIVTIVGVARSLVAALRSPEPWPVRRVQMRRKVSRSLARATCALFPVFAFFGGHLLKLPDISFILRHRARLEAAAADLDGEAHGFDGVARDGDRVIIQVSASGVGDSYWLVHDASASPDTVREEPVRVSFFSQVRARHVFGAWYSCDQD